MNVEDRPRPPEGDTPPGRAAGRPNVWAAAKDRIATRPHQAGGREAGREASPGGARRRSGPAVLLLAALAAACGDRSAAAPPEELLTLRTVGLAHLEDGRLDQAAEAFRELIRAAPREALGHANLGVAQLRRDRAGEALDPLERAVELRPDDPIVRFDLAAAYEALGRQGEAREVLEGTVRRSARHLRTLYELARLHGAPGGEPARRRQYLARILELDPANLVVRLELAEERLRAGESDPAAALLEPVPGLVPELPPEAVEALRRATARSLGGEAAEALPSLLELRNLSLVTPSYQESFRRLHGPVAGLIGIPVPTFGPDVPEPSAGPGPRIEGLRFVDVTEASGLARVAASRTGEAAGGPPAFVAMADLDRDGRFEILAVRGGRPRLLADGRDGFADATPGPFGRMTGVRSAAVGDFDDDGRLDLYLVGSGPNLLLRADGSGAWEDVTARAGVGDPGQGRRALFADLDHDGDLDLFLVNGDGHRFYRNDGDGTFEERAEAAGLRGGGRSDGRDAAFGDFDGDADLDLVVAGEEGGLLYWNLREGRFRAERSGSGDGRGATVVAVADYDNDGDLDLFLGGAGGTHGMWRNRGDGTFERDARSDALSRSLGDLEALDAAWLDYDNDGFLDLLVAGRPAAGARGAHLFRNQGDGALVDASDALPADLAAVSSVAVADRDGDGDLDLALATPDGGLRLLDNEGGSVHHHLKVRLVGLTAGSGKVNHFGIGSTVELRDGPLYQMRVVTEPVTHFGLGERASADALRIVWTNGIPQSVVGPTVDATLVEEQVLKGSCAFVYAWDGERFRFVTDAMWRSAIGMPVGIMAGPASPRSEGGAAAPEDPRRTPARAGDRLYAPPQASREYLRIPGELLRPADGSYRLRITEELWEVAYVDEVKLVAVDHPEAVEVFVDERFVPPGPPRLRLHAVARRHLPVSAVDGDGDDLLSRLEERDDVYVDDLAPGPYQGITEIHDLVLDLGKVAAGAEVVHLFLQGWVFPTDASINVALSQSDDVDVRPPVLQVPDGRGGWRTAIDDLGFPAGKAKTVVADVSGHLVAGDPRVRVRTNMQVYWDHAFFTTGPSAGPALAAPADGLAEAARRLESARGGPGTGAAPLGPHGGRLSVLRPAAAELRHRGFSREYRKGGRHGPHWFDYDDVSGAPRWLPIRGRYTRYGDVLPLLRASDDRYVILAPGDEIALEFPVAGAPDPPRGWRRTFLLYTDGWIKDADLNTATGNTVEPLPFHGMSRYPYGEDETFPSDEASRRWDEVYNTRVVR